MKYKGIIIVGVIVAALAVWGISISNQIVSADEEVQSAWSNVENVYKRRMDLIPQLVATVQGAANFEKSVLTEITNARAGVEQTKVDPSELTEEQIAAYQKAQDELGKAVARTIKISVENYPTLTATAGFRDLQVQLEGTENRIAVERGRFTEKVQAYNTLIRKFPNSIVAKLSGFSRKGYFTAPAGAEEPVDVHFDF